MKKLIVTGGSGFIGTNAVEFFENKGFDVLNIDIKEPKNGKRLSLWRKCDITNLQEYKRIVLDFDPDCFLHLAARTDLLEAKKLDGYSANIEGVANTVHIIGESNVKRSLFASSRMVCKIDYLPENEIDYCPPNLYGQSKVEGEKIVRDSQLDCEWMIFRPTSIWGEYFDIPYRDFFDKIKQKQYFHPGKYDPNKSFGYVGNSVFQIEKLLTAPAKDIHGSTLYLADYPPINLKHWANQVAREFGQKGIRTAPTVLLKAAAIVGDLTKRLGLANPPLTSFRLNNLVTNMVYDTSTLQDICGELPFNLEESVKRTVNWLVGLEKG
ncbi:MAG: NAD(P)-dependent oxidoreductase [Cyclobacteriaceae bacterium]